MRKIVTAFLVLLLAITQLYAADKTFTAGETLNLTGDVTWDNAYSLATDTDWAIVTGAYDITVTGEADLRYVSFQNTGTITFSVNGSGDYIRLRNCVITGASSLTIGTAATTPLASNITIDQCDIRGIPTITITGTNGTATGEAYIRRSTFDADTAALILIQNIDGFRIEDNVFNNYQFGNTQGSNWNVAGGMIYRRNFQTADSDITVNGSGSNFKWVTVNVSQPKIEALNNYWYLDVANPHPVATTSSGVSDADEWIGNIFEVIRNTDGANILSVDGNRALTATYNIHIGSGSLLNNVGSSAFLTLTGQNNTCYCTFAGNDGDGMLFLSESGPASGTINLSNNIITGSANPGDAINSITGTQTISSSDYNWFYNVTNAYDDVTVTSGQTNDTSGTDPDFVDPTRCLTDWYQERYSDVSPTKAEAVDKLLALNGYNSTSKTQSDTAITYTVIDLVNYVKAGFVPQAAGCNQGGASSEDIGALSDEGWNVWADTALVKNRRDGEDDTSGSTSISVKMAKNEIESFQVFVYADGAGLDNVDIELSEITNGANTLDDVYVYKQHYVNCSTASRAEYQTGYYPDALIPRTDRYYNEYRSLQWPVNVTTSDVQGFWVDIGTTSSTSAGTYTGTITVMADGKKPEIINLSVTVWDFALPSTSTFKSAIGIQSGYISYAHMSTPYHITTMTSLVPLYNKALLYHRVGSWTHGDVIDVTYDWDSETDTLSNLDVGRWETYHENVRSGTAISSGPYANAKSSATHLPWVNPLNVTETNESISDDEKETALRQYMQAWYNYFDGKGWEPDSYLFLGVPDEPHGSSLTWLREESDSATDFHVCIDIANDAAATDIGNNIFANVHNCSELNSFVGFFDPWIGRFAPDYWEKSNEESTYIYPHSGYPAADNYWAYLSCMNNACGQTGASGLTGEVDLSTDAPAIYNRLWSMVFRKHGRTGFLFWDINDGYYSSGGDPFLSSLYGGGSNGDGLLIYPGYCGEFGTAAGANTPNIGGSHDIPIESIRLKYVRDVIEDMEYMQLADNLGKASSVNTYVDGAFTDTTINLCYWNLNTSVSNLLSIRENIAGLITGSSPAVSGNGVSGSGVSNNGGG